MKRDDFASVNLDVSLGRESRAVVRDDEPFRILIAGDFGGRSGARAGRDAIPSRRPVPVDRDNFDEVFRAMGVELEMPVAGRIRFQEFDDFHPDQLYEALPLFTKLREARDMADAPPSRPPVQATPPVSFQLGNLLDEAISATESRTAANPAKDPFRAWLDNQVAPSLERSATPQSESRRALVDSVISAQMRAVIHYPGFQALEALWTMVHFLVRRIDTDSQLRLYLFDAGREGLGHVSNLSGNDGWSILAVAASFGPDPADLELLTSLGQAAVRSGAVLLADAAPQLIGCPSFASLPEPSRWASPAAEWDNLRHSEVAPSIGLVLPRILLRLPYGARTNACSRFEFEEMGADFEHSRLLWGSGALASLALFGEAFSEGEWAMRPERHRDLDRLPIYVHGTGASAVAVPCAETGMTMEGAEAILERGPMVLASVKNSDQVRMVRFQSIADPPSALAARW